MARTLFGLWGWVRVRLPLRFVVSVSLPELFNSVNLWLNLERRMSVKHYGEGKQSRKKDENAFASKENKPGRRKSLENEKTTRTWKVFSIYPSLVNYLRYKGLKWGMQRKNVEKGLWVYSRNSLSVLFLKVLNQNWYAKKPKLYRALDISEKPGRGYRSIFVNFTDLGVKWRFSFIHK